MKSNRETIEKQHIMKDKLSDRSLRLEKEAKLEVLLEFQEWFNEELGPHMHDREICWRDVKEYLIKDCPVCRHKVNASLEDWLECRMCR
jgi:hypothetical protein